MEQKQQVFFSIKRSVDTRDGQILNYLQTEPFGLGSLPEIVMLTLKQHWSPFAISTLGVRGEELRQRAIWSIEQLEGQAALIRGVFLESYVKTVAMENNAQWTNDALAQKQVIDFDDPAAEESNNGLISIEMPEKMKQINKLFGVE